MTYERRGGPQEVDHSRPSEVLEVARVVEPAAGVPSPVRDGRVDTAGDDDGVDEVGHELASLRYGSGDDCRSRGSKHKLKKKGWKND